MKHNSTLPIRLSQLDQACILAEVSHYLRPEPLLHDLILGYVTSQLATSREYWRKHCKSSTLKIIIDAAHAHRSQLFRPQIRHIEKLIADYQSACNNEKLRHFLNEPSRAPKYVNRKSNRTLNQSDPPASGSGNRQHPSGQPDCAKPKPSTPAERKARSRAKRSAVAKHITTNTDCPGWVGGVYFD
jgi:hypothetical protein